MSHKSLLTIAAAFTIAIAPADAAVVAFNLIGLGGAGLLGSNERPSAISPAGTGGEIGAGITFDNVSNILTINIGWGTGNGYADLTSAVTNAHIHGPVAGTTLTDFMTGTAGVPSGFGIFTNVPAVTSPTNGAISVTRTFTAGQAAQLMEGRFYINIHTTTNAGGEIRGNLVPVPEPSSTLLGGLALLLAVRRSRRS
jgi:hypothetical protein